MEGTEYARRIALRLLHRASTSFPEPHPAPTWLGQSKRWETTFTIVPLGSRSMNRRTPHSSSLRG